MGEEPRAVIAPRPSAKMLRDEAMMLHNGVDPTQTEGMSKGAHRSEGVTGRALESEDVEICHDGVYRK